MSEPKKEQPDTKSIKPQTRPRPTPRASLPPRAAPLFGRPMVSSPVQREKRRALRQGKPTGSVTAKVAAGEGEMLLFGSIGEDWWGEGITDKSFNESLQALGNVNAIRLRINSGGGDVFHATAIYNMLVKHDAKVIVEIEGVAASAATLIAMAADEIRISENAHFMIHAASGIAWGNADELRQYLKLLDNADELIRLTYSARTGIDAEELRSMMDHDNWMTAKEALDLGFADAMDAAKSITPHITPEQAADSPTPANRMPVISQERLAAYADQLLSLSAALRQIPPKQTGSSPQTVPQEKETTMSAKMRAKCLAAGMPEALTGEAADKWLDDNFEKVTAPTPAPVVTATVQPPSVAEPLTAEKILDLVEAREKRQLEARKTWRKEVDANISLAFGDNPPAALKDTCYDLQADGIDAVRAKIQEARKKAGEAISTGIRIDFAASQPRDRHISALRTGVLHRALSNFQPADDARRFRQNERGHWEPYQLSTVDVLNKHLPEKDRAKGWEDFSHMPLSKIAEEALYCDGLRHEQVRRLSTPQIAMAALGFYRQAGIRAEGALHTTGSLAEITRDAINKSLIAGYEEAPQTWRGPMRQGTSVSDFKDIYRVRLGAVSNIPVWPDNTKPEQAKLSNEKEKYAAEARALMLSFSWRLVINDDMDALSRRPQLMGDACARTANKVAWQQVTDNGPLQDAVALFATATGARKRDNLITGSATPTNTTIGAMRKLMRLMRGLNTPEGAEGDDVLNLSPTYIVGPAALEELILKQVNSGADPASGGNSAVFNTARNLIPIIEPLLDANSATAWYLFASPGRVDTVELSFLEGFETPVPHEWIDDETMAQNFSIIHAYNAKAIDYRGMIKHAGA